MRALSVFLCLSLLLPALAFANDGNVSEGEWRLIREAQARGQVSTWVRPVDDHTLNAFKGQIEVPHNMLTAFAVLADIERFPEWVFQCDYAHLMPQFGHDVAYVHIDGIWPVSDRDVVTRSTISQQPQNLAIRVHTVAQHGLFPAQPDTVRIPVLENDFIMEPLADGWTRITFETFVDPGGALPAWLANLVSIRAPRDTLEGMAQQMAEAKYHLVTPEQLPVQFPGVTELLFPNLGKTPAEAPPAPRNGASQPESEASPRP